MAKSLPQNWLFREPFLSNSFSGSGGWTVKSEYENSDFRYFVDYFLDFLIIFLDFR